MQSTLAIILLLPINSKVKRAIVMDDALIVADGKTKDILEDEKLLTEHRLEKP